MTVLSLFKNRWTHLHLTQWPQLYPVGIFKKTMNRNEANAVKGHIFQQIHVLPRPLTFTEDGLRILFRLQSHHKMTVTKSAKCTLPTGQRAEQFHIHYVIYSDYDFSLREGKITALLIGNQ